MASDHEVAGSSPAGDTLFMLAKLFFFISFSFIIGFLARVNYLFLIFLTYLIIFKKPIWWYLIAACFTLIGFLYSGIIIFKNSQSNIFYVFDYPQKFENFQKIVLKDNQGNIYFALIDLKYDLKPGTIIEIKDSELDKRTFIFPQIKIIGQRQTLLFYFYHLREFLESRIKKYLPFPEENILRGLIFGSEIADNQLRQNFQRSGLSHLTAVSGYNLTLITSIIQKAFSQIPFLTQNIVFILSLITIFIFVLIMGFKASVLRAAVIGIILILLKKLGYYPLKLNLLILTFLLFIFWHPELVIFDIGIHLSFLAFFGILYLKDIWPNKLPDFIKETLSAQLVTAPYVIFISSQFNIFSILANILVLPVIPIVMVIGLVAVLLPLISMIAWPFLVYIEIISKIFNLFNYNLIVPNWFLLVVYFLLGFYFLIKRKNDELDINFLSR